MKDLIGILAVVTAACVIANCVCYKKPLPPPPPPKKKPCNCFYKRYCGKY